MNRRYVVSLAVALTLAASAASASAQDLSRYRDYAFGASVADIVAQTRSQAASVKTLHERPARLQQLEWFAGYSPEGPARDPVRSIVFRFVDDQLYEMVVTYERARTEGLTAADLVEALTTTYGPPMLADGRAAPAGRQTGMGVDTAVVASWLDAAGSLSLHRNLYTPEFQLLLRSTVLSTAARTAGERSRTLDASEAPAREREQQQRDAADAKAAAEKARIANKAAFRP
jgi:hypothetical protein